MSDYETKQTIDRIERDVQDIKKTLDEMKEKLGKINDSVCGIEISLEN